MTNKGYGIEGYGPGGDRSRDEYVADLVGKELAPAVLDALSALADQMAAESGPDRNVHLIALTAELRRCLDANTKSTVARIVGKTAGSG